MISMISTRCSSDCVVSEPLPPFATYFCTSQADRVELLKEDYSLTEHRQLVQEDAFQCIVFADGGPSLKVPLTPLTNEMGPIGPMGPVGVPFQSTPNQAVLRYQCKSTVQYATYSTLSKKQIFTTFLCWPGSISSTGLSHPVQNVLSPGYVQWVQHGNDSRVSQLEIELQPSRRVKRSLTTFSPSRFPAKSMVASWLRPRGLLERRGPVRFCTHNARRSDSKYEIGVQYVFDISETFRNHLPHLHWTYISSFLE